VAICDLTKLQKIILPRRHKIN